MPIWKKDLIQQNQEMVPSKFEVAEDDQLIGKAFRFENSVKNCRERVLVMQNKDKGSFWQMKLFFC